MTLGSKDGGDPSFTGRRKDGKPFKDGNIGEDGTYSVGKNRPPKDGQFRKGDGRKRGRREKGVRNADTEFMRELNRKVTIKENGAERRVTKGHAVDLRLIDNATRKGDNKAIDMVDQRRRRIAEDRENNRRYHTIADREILEAFLREREKELGINPALFGDPEPDPPLEMGGDAGESDA
ncbi:MAG: hypothetical protein GW859_09840 [Sphingomonadales bacterium]|nr:hypothetical protein [Sphingomonadales bacterium]